MTPRASDTIARAMLALAVTGLVVATLLPWSSDRVGTDAGDIRDVDHNLWDTQLAGAVALSCAAALLLFVAVRLPRWTGRAIGAGVIAASTAALLSRADRVTGEANYVLRGYGATTYSSHLATREHYTGPWFATAGIGFAALALAWLLATVLRGRGASEPR